MRILFKRVLFFLSFVLEVISASGGNPPNIESLVKYQPVKAIAILNKVPASSRDMNYYLHVVTAKENLGNHTEVDSMIDAIIKDSRLRNDSVLMMKFLIVSAENDKILDRFEEALVDFNEVLDYRERHHDTLGVIDAYLMLAEFYRATDNYEFSMDYLNKVKSAGALLTGGLPPMFKSRMLNRKAAVYSEQRIFLDSVELFSKEVIRIGKELGDLNQVAIASNELGFLYMNLGRKESVAYFEEALGIWESLDYGIYANNARLNLARYYSRNGNPRKAIEICEAGLKIIKAEKWVWEEGYSYEVMSIAYHDLGDFKNAALYANKAKEQLLYNARNQYRSRLAYFINKIQLKEKEEEINTKNLEVITAQKEVVLKSEENNRLFILLLILCILFIGSFLGFLIINKQKRQLADQRKVIDKNVIALNQVVQQKEVLLKEVNHRVKNNLSLLSGLMYLKEKELKSDEAVHAMQQMQGRINTISLIHEGLYQQDDVERINFSDYLKRLTQHIRNIVSKGDEVKLTIDCLDFNPELQVAIPLAMMMNELMTNSLKHAFKEVTFPEISIKYDPIRNQLVYMDNGPGYENTVIDKGSLGQRLIQIFARQIGAEVKHEQSNGFSQLLIILKDKMNG